MKVQSPKICKKVQKMIKGAEKLVFFALNASTLQSTSSKFSKISSTNSYTSLAQDSMVELQNKIIIFCSTQLK